MYRTFKAFEVCGRDHCFLGLRTCNSVLRKLTSSFPPQASQSSNLYIKLNYTTGRTQIPRLIFSIQHSGVKHNFLSPQAFPYAGVYHSNIRQKVVFCAYVVNDVLLLSFSLKTQRKHLYTNKDRTKKSCLVLQGTLQELNQWEDSARQRKATTGARCWFGKNTTDLLYIWDRKWSRHPCCSTPTSYPSPSPPVRVSQDARTFTHLQLHKE